MKNAVCQRSVIKLYTLGKTKMTGGAAENIVVFQRMTAYTRWVRASENVTKGYGKCKCFIWIDGLLKKLMS